jgi:hypothetical protein
VLDLLCELLPSSNQGTTGKVYFGFRELERLTEGILVETQTAGETQFKFVNHAKLLGRFVSQKSQGLRAFQEQLTHRNQKVRTFILQLVDLLASKSFYDMSSKFEGVLAGFPLHSSSPEFKLTVTNLFILAVSFEVLEIEIARFLFKVASGVDAERPTPVSLSHADFLMEMFAVYLRFRDKNAAKPSHRTVDPFINYFLDFLPSLPPKLSTSGLEKVFGLFSDSFLEVVLRLESPRILHYFMPLLCSLRSEVTVQGRPGTFRELFFQRLFQSLMSSQNPSVVKERTLGFIQSYILAMSVESTFIYEVVYYLQQMLFLLTKKIVKKARQFCSEDSPGIDPSGVAGHWLRAAFNTPLFARLVCCITSILTDNVETISTHAKIDIINFFELYFSRFFECLRIPLRDSPCAHDVFVQLNRFLRISRLFELEDHYLPPPVASSPLVKRPMLSSTYCSMSSASDFSVSSATANDGSSKPGKGVWKLQPPTVTFDGRDVPFFRQFLVRHGRYDLRSRPTRDDCSDSESLSLSRRSSVSPGDFPLLQTSVKRVKGKTA